MNIKEYMEINFPKRTGKYQPNMSGVLVEMKPEPEELQYGISYPELNLEMTDRMFAEFAECEEFCHAESVERYDKPFILDRNGKVLESAFVKVTENVRFHGRAIIQDVSFFSEPNTYNPNGAVEYGPVFKGACITPLVYDQETFEPRRHIVIRFSPENENGLENKDFKRTMHELLDEILEFPEAFMWKPERVTHVRGYFERVDEGEKTTVRDLSGVGNPNEREGECEVYFFFESTVSVVDGQIKIDLGKYYLPSEYSDAVRAELGDSVNREQLTEFMQRHGRQDIIDLNDSTRKQN